jgi:hypothetical protein
MGTEAVYVTGQIRQHCGWQFGFIASQAMLDKRRRGFMIGEFRLNSCTCARSAVPSTLNGVQGPLRLRRCLVKSNVPNSNRAEPAQVSDARRSENRVWEVPLHHPSDGITELFKALICARISCRPQPSAGAAVVPRAVSFAHYYECRSFGSSPNIGQKSTRINTAAAQAALPIADFVMDVGGGELSMVVLHRYYFVETALNPTLALGQLLAYLGIHSRSLSLCGVWQTWTLIKPRKSQRISSFFRFFSKITPRASLG